MLAALWQLKQFVLPYKAGLFTGIGAFGVARLFEVMVPALTAVAINKMASGDFEISMQVFGIVGAVIARYCVVTFARFNVRKVALKVSYDLRQQLFEKLQQQGSEFFGQYSIGDMMTRAVADISLVQRLISMGTILVIILIYAAIVGFGFMLYYSPVLTLLLLPPMPIIFFYAQYSSKAMGIASVQVQERLSDLGTHTQENLSGIRTIQAMVQEDNEIDRFGQTNQAYADVFYEQGHGLLDAQPSCGLFADYIELRRLPSTARHPAYWQLCCLLHVSRHGCTAFSRGRFYHQFVSAGRRRKQALV
jgi:ABC-type multidrug transport system fused ATPase/permease subunit